MRILKLWTPLFCIILFLLMLSELRFDADVFGLLPKTAETVSGLKTYQNEFGSSHALILVLKGEDSEKLLRATEDLAQHLRDAELADEIVWQSPFRQDSAALADLVAYLWLNQPAEAFDKMLARFDPQKIDAYLVETLDRMTTSFNTQEVARLANDPFGLSSVMTHVDVDARRDPFVSADGRLRIIYASYPGSASGYWGYRNWLAQIETSIRALEKRDMLANGVSVELTGNPVFVHEFGSRLLRDLVLAAVSTLVLVVLLFWWAHRRWSPLFWLVLLLACTLLLTIGIASVFFESLSILSLGFAVILLGLTVDYGLIAYQEYRTNPKRSASEIRRILMPSIVWAALTTAGAFFMMARSSLPGMTQLGVLVALGILIAAALVLLLYLPSVSSSEGSLVGSVPIVENRFSMFLWPVTLVVFLSGVGVLLWAPPQVNTNIESLQYQNVDARRVHKEFQLATGGSQDDLWLIIEGVDEAAVGESFDALRTLVDSLPYAVAVALPAELWPQVDLQKRNREALQTLDGHHDAIERALTNAGFTEEAQRFTRVVLDTWAQQREASSVVWPEGDSARWLMSQFSSRTDKRVMALGTLAVDNSVPKQTQLALFSQINSLDGVMVVGWSLLADSLAATMVDDARNVVLPMIVALVVFLGLAFRDFRDIALSFATLVFSIVCLSALMSLFGWSWNIMNMTALPLLLGAGVDYSIHIQMALKRFHGDRIKAYRSVGLAILLCGASTTAAFASLGFASNPGIASLGKVAALGIAVACLTAVFLLPGWWLAARGGRISAHTK